MKCTTEKFHKISSQVRWVWYKKNDKITHQYTVQYDDEYLGWLKSHRLQLKNNKIFANQTCEWTNTPEIPEWAKAYHCLWEYTYIYKHVFLLLLFFVFFVCLFKISGILPHAKCLESFLNLNILRSEDFKELNPLKSNFKHRNSRALK